MNADALVTILEGELRGFPGRAPAEDLYRHMLAVATGTATTDRPALVGALREWIGLHTEPRTMIALHLARELRLVELRGDVEQLRADVSGGKALLPYYVRWVDEALHALSRP